MKPAKIDREKFDRDCVEEYAEVFKTVCVDAAFYRFPDEKSLSKLVAQVPADFLFAFKVSRDWDSLNQALASLGLELAATNISIQTLVVEKAK